MSAKGLVTFAFVACWVLCTLCMKSTAYGPLNHACCVKYTQKPLAFRLIKGYIEQSSLEVCRIDAIIFLTKGNRKVCASTEDDWVRAVLMRLSTKMKTMSKLQPNHDAGFSTSMLSAGNLTTDS